MEYVFDPLTVKEWTMPLKSAKEGTLTFEKSPFYLSSMVAAQEMSSLLPSVRLVAMLREPGARAYSSFYHHCQRNKRLIEVSMRVTQAPPSVSSCGTSPTLVLRAGPPTSILAPAPLLRALRSTRR